ncbi:MAG TPA: BLUF domain-containing protein, partial [Allocoleopsis sp.]
MKRLTYISKLSRNLTSDQIEDIGKVSQVNNARYHITGVLLYSGGIFFQILEGDTEAIDMVYARILTDDRHTEILCLKNEENITERLFPDWSMKTINLDDDIDLLMKPIKTLLNSVTESHRILEKYTQPTIFRIMKQG